MQVNAHDCTLTQDDNNGTVERILLSRQTELTEKANGVCLLSTSTIEVTILNYTWPGILKF